MNLRLKIAELLIRGRLVTRWLRLVDRSVCASLMELIGDDAAVEAINGKGMPKRPEDYRKAMAEKHAQLVSLLMERKGRVTAIKEGREAMYAAGFGLGERLRSELRLSDDMDDLMRAAKLLYRILGIEFEIMMDGKGGRMMVKHCSLSERYLPLTCEVISAMDEGVVTGLNPRMRMMFVRMNGTGLDKCEARLTWKDMR